ncbi:hypothetical protein KW801_02555 [Candidatus Saccharibacteria bacterium]|nr:hypothetical protein [Candidatus Saccharibacteria bacterium]
MKYQPTNKNQRGSLIVSILMVMLFLFIIVTSLAVLADSNLSRAKGRVLLLESQYAAESGADAAIAYLNSDPNSTYSGTSSETTILTNNLYKATFSTTVVAGATGDQKIITSTGRLYQPASAAQANYTRKIEVIAQRTAGSSGISGILSRNIIELQSGVKNVYAKDLYVNGYINMNKNTTNIVAENITAAGKNTGASNCSIGGIGNLIKPGSFVTPGQTKTKITIAFNNCINPPGNTSNANFDVLANQTNIDKVQSTYIPWSQYMDSSYQNSVQNCNDWTSGSFPRTIPSTGNTKKTHYPDNGSNISSSCGNSGDLSLATGQYNIADNVHIRANLCAATACTPTFYNSNSAPKYIFVEGSINFDSLQTAAGSGPIILISYGADPASKTSICPLGGAIYLGNNGNTSAPAVYLLANNGVCLDKTKFNSSPALAGLSGKNVYIATNPGTPFDLKLDTAFDSSSVPINLAWHAAKYRRL